MHAVRSLEKAKIGRRYGQEMDKTHSAVHTIVSLDFTAPTQLWPELLKGFFGLGSWTGFLEFTEKQQSRCLFAIPSPVCD